jgi:phosphate-selective porin OprO/OprP
MNFNKKIAVAVSGAVLLLAGQIALADSTTDIVDALVSKGVLTEEEGKLITKGHVSKQEKTPKVTEKDGAFKLESANGKNSIQLTGRMHFDARSIDGKGGYDSQTNAIDRDSASLADNFELRRARIGVKGTFAKHYDYEVLTNLVGSSSNLIDVAYVNAGMYKPLQFKAGIFKQPFNLEEYGTSSNNIDFMERSYINQITPAKKGGFMLHGALENGITYAGSVYQQNTFGETDSNSTGKGFAGRGTMNLSQLIGSKETVFHLGVAGFDSEYGVLPASSSNSDNASCTTVDATAPATGYVTTCSAATATNGTIFSFRSEGRGLSNIYRAQIGGDKVKAGPSVPSNSAAKVNNRAYGLELAAAYGPFKVQGEYTDQDFNANVESVGSSVKSNVTAGYIEALWMVTGENYADWYKNGAWGGIKPKNEFDVDTLKGLGAWEVGFRYDAFDVSDVAISSGTGASGSSRIQGSKDGSNNGGAKTYTAGIKWQLNSIMRVLANYSHTKFDYAFTPVDLASGSGTITKEDILMVRTQFNF